MYREQGLQSQEHFDTIQDLEPAPTENVAAVSTRQRANCQSQPRMENDFQVKERECHSLREIDESEQPKVLKDITSNVKKATNSRRDTIIQKWKEGTNAPCKIRSNYNAVADDSALYVRRVNDVYAYTLSTSTWSQLPDSKVDHCPSVIINNFLTLIGGCKNFPTTTDSNVLYSLTGEGSRRKWTEMFPPMPTKRHDSTALCAEKSLIVAGGLTITEERTKITRKVMIETVEVMDTTTFQWSIAASLPHPMSSAPGVVCKNNVHILSLSSGSKSMYTCSVSSLIKSCGSRHATRIWYSVTAPPVVGTTCLSIHGQLLAFGGTNSNGKHIPSVYVYNATTDSWTITSRMLLPRSECYTGLLPNNKVMVVGGWTEDGLTDSVEIAQVILDNRNCDSDPDSSCTDSDSDPASDSDSSSDSA